MSIFKEKEQTYKQIKEHLIIIQTIPGLSTPLDTIFLQEFLDETFSVSNSTIQKNETDNSKRIELEHNFHDKLYCFKIIIV